MLVTLAQARASESTISSIEDGTATLAFLLRYCLIKQHHLWDDSLVKPTCQPQLWGQPAPDILHYLQDTLLSYKTPIPWSCDENIFFAARYVHLSLLATPNMTQHSLEDAEAVSRINPPWSAAEPPPSRGPCLHPRPHPHPWQQRCPLRRLKRSHRQPPLPPGMAPLRCSLDAPAHTIQA